MDELINKIVKLPLVTKLGILAGIIVAVTAGNWWFFVQDLNDKTTREERTLNKLKDDLINKQAIANNLNQYRREMELLEQQLKEALTEMPEEVKMDALLAQLAELSEKAGLSLTSIAPQSEAKEGTFYYRIPIKMAVSGSYHEIAVFLDAVSKLKRIVNVNNINLGGPNMKSDKVILKADYLATTFRFAGNQAASQTAKKGGH